MDGASGQRGYLVTTTIEDDKDRKFVSMPTPWVNVRLEITWWKAIRLLFRHRKIEVNVHLESGSWAEFRAQGFVEVANGENR